MFGVQQLASRSARRFASLAAVLVLGAATPALAQYQNVYGSGAIITDRPCGATGSGNCVVGAARLQPDHFYGGFGFAEDSRGTFVAGGGLAGSYVTFDPASNLPTMGTYSYAGPDARLGSTVIAFRTYNYLGPMDIDIAYRGVLTYGTSGDLVVGDAPHEGTVNVSFAVVDILHLLDLFPPGSTGQDIINASLGIPDCSSGAIAATSFGAFGQGLGTYSHLLNLDTTCSGGRISLHNGDSFAIIAVMQAISNRDGWADAIHTLDVQYDPEHSYISGTDELVDPSVFALIDSTVPEPSSWLLAIAGFGLTGAALRRRRRPVGRLREV